MPFSGSDISRVDIIEIESLKRDDIMIAVIRPTGSGKSRFIQNAWGFDSDLGVGPGLEPFTQQVIAYRFTFAASAKRERVVLFDTSGFDSTKRPDLEVLDGLCKLLRKSIPLTGILYMHGIYDDPIPGTALRYMKHFEQSCGEEGLGRVFMVTTMWGEEHEEGMRINKEGELTQGYWNVILKYGSPNCSFMNTRQSAWGILDSLLDMWNGSDTSWNTQYQPRAQFRHCSRS